MAKTLRKEITVRSKTKNTCNKKPTHENLRSCKKQPNFFIRLLQQMKKNYLSDLNIKDLSGNKKFWEAVEPYFNNKEPNSNKLILFKLACVFNDYLPLLLQIWNPPVKTLMKI